jgi:hypothetical protein
LRVLGALTNYVILVGLLVMGLGLDQVWPVK